MQCREVYCNAKCFEVYHTKLHFLGSPDTKMEKRNLQISVITTIVITDIWIEF
jgi:hypothetical protein